MDPLPDLLREVAAIQREQLRHADLLPLVRARLEAHRTSSRRAPGFERGLLRRLLLPAGGLGLAAVAAAALLWMRAPARLSFEVGAARRSGQAGELLTAQPNADLPVQFSDGSHLALAAGAQLKVVEVVARGATLAMERGGVEVEVVHRSSTHWVFQAGPFDVTVTGTRFLLRWDPDSETLSVDMHEGSVDVSGGPAGAGGLGSSGHATVRTGERLRMSRRTGGVARASAGTTPGAAAPAPSLPAPATEPASDLPTAASAIAAAARSPEPAPAAARSLRSAPPVTATDETWRRLAAEARYPEALRVAARGGFETACRRLNAEDLVLLGDVARLAGDPARAEKAYLTARSRFPTLDRPLFALGLTAFEQRRDFGRAAGWFEQYLRQYPGGALNREAAGRALESWRRAGDGERARQAARDYLARYPAGPHAGLARQTIAP